MSVGPFASTYSIVLTIYCLLELVKMVDETLSWRELSQADAELLMHSGTTV